jgi:hypothetical protein
VNAGQAVRALGAALRHRAFFFRFKPAIIWNRMYQPGFYISRPAFGKTKTQPINLCRVVLSLLLLAGIDAAAQVPDLDLATLKGIKGVNIHVGIAKDIEDAGLGVDAIKTDAELKLRQFGIRVLDQREAAVAPGTPVLDVAVEGVSLKGTYAFFVSVSLLQNVLLERDLTLRAIGKYRGQPFPAQTWNTGMTGIAFGNPSDTVRSTVKDLVDRFINDYLAANEKGNKQ